MKHSKEQLNNIAQNTGFRAEIIEKVPLLMDISDAFARDPILKQQMVLKGGTALNLFYLNLLNRIRKCCWKLWDFIYNMKVSFQLINMNFIVGAA